MEDPSIWYCTAVAGVLYLFSTFFSIVKIVFSAVDRHGHSSDDQRLRTYAGDIRRILDRRSIFTTTVSFGKTCTNAGFALAIFFTARSLAPSLSRPRTALVSLVASIVILGVFAHVLPRALALRFHVALIPLVYRTYTLLEWLLRPFTSLLAGLHRLLLRIVGYDERFAFLSKEEKQRMDEDENGEEGLDEEEREMIHSIFELGETTVREIMVPRVDVQAIEIGADFDTVLTMIRELGHSRIPVFKENVDSIVGILYAKDIIGWISRRQTPESWNLSAVMKKPHFVPVGKKIDDLMRELKAKQIHIAVAVDEYGGTAGIVTMEDILEEIVGEIQDEYDVEESTVIKVDENRWHVDPHTDLHDLEEELDLRLDLDDAAYNTLGGLIYHEYGDIPRENTELEYNGLRLKVLQMDNQRIEKVELEVVRRENGNESNGKA